MGELFTRTELIEGEALRQHIAAQIPGQIGIWDACADVDAEAAERGEPIAVPAGMLFDRAELDGQLVLS